jgi:hypothetical protein
MTTLHGGPLDGEEMDLAWATPAELRDGLALICERGIYGPGGRSLYSLHPDGVMRHDGDTP